MVKEGKVSYPVLRALLNTVSISILMGKNVGQMNEKGTALELPFYAGNNIKDFTSNIALCKYDDCKLQ